MRTAIRIFREELIKAANALLSAHRTLSEIDARTMQALIALLGRSK